MTSASVRERKCSPAFLGIAAAALEDEALLIAHPAELLFGNLLNTHSFISPIVIDCS